MIGYQEHQPRPASAMVAAPVCTVKWFRNATTIIHESPRFTCSDRAAPGHRQRERSSSVFATRHTRLGTKGRRGL